MPEQTIETHGTGDDRRIRTRTWYHIGVTALRNNISMDNDNIQQVVIVQQPPPQSMTYNGINDSEGQALVPKELEGQQIRDNIDNITNM